MQACQVASREKSEWESEKEGGRRKNVMEEEMEMKKGAGVAVEKKRGRGLSLKETQGAGFGLISKGS